MEEIELYFRVEEVNCEIKAIDAQIDRLKLEKSKLLYEANILNEELVEIGLNNKQEIKEEVKPKKLRKPNDKSSEDNTEVQLKEGRS